MSSGTADSPSSWLDRLHLSWALKLLSSSIGQKLVMAITGLLLCGFLVGHLAGNLLLFKGERDFNEYADWIHHQKVLPLVEAGLFLLFLAHIYLAFSTARQNTAARHTPYTMKHSKVYSRVAIAPARTWMFLSGSIVLGFVLLHLADLRVGIRPDLPIEGETPNFQNVVTVLSNPISRTVYFVGSIILGFHLSHGFASAFRTLGLAHPKYTPTVNVLSIVFAVVIGAGFASLPVIVPELYSVQKQTAPAETAARLPGAAAANGSAEKAAHE